MAYASGCSVKVHLTRKAYQSNEQEYSKQIRKTLSKTRQRLPGQRLVKHFRTYFLHRAPGESVTKFTTPSIACCCVSRSLSERFCCCRPLPRLLPLAVPLALFKSSALLLQPADLISGPSAERLGWSHPTDIVKSARHGGEAQWASRSLTPGIRCVTYTRTSCHTVSRTQTSLIFHLPLSAARIELEPCKPSGRGHSACWLKVK